LRGTSYPEIADQKDNTATGFRLGERAQQVATLGLIAESLWDSRKKHSSKTWFAH